MITPVEVLGKELKRGFGYKAIEVDEFLEDLARDYEKIYKVVSLSNFNICLCVHVSCWS